MYFLTNNLVEICVPDFSIILKLYLDLMSPHSFMSVLYYSGFQ